MDTRWTLIAIMQPYQARYYRLWGNHGQRQVRIFMDHQGWYYVTPTRYTWLPSNIEDATHDAGPFETFEEAKAVAAATAKILSIIGE